MRCKGLFLLGFSLSTVLLCAQSQPIRALQSLRKGNQAYQSGAFKAARNHYQKALQADSSSLKANYNLGNAYYRSKRWKEALAQYQQSAAQAQTPAQKARSLYNMGGALMAQKQYGPAVKAYLQALRNAPRDEQIRYNYALAKSLLKKQQREKNQKRDQKKDKNKGDKGNQKDKDREKPGDQKKKHRDAQKDKKRDQKPQHPAAEKRAVPLSDKQIDRLLKALQDAENKTQKKVRAKQQKKSKPVKMEKDW